MKVINKTLSKFVSFFFVHVRGSTEIKYVNIQSISSNVRISVNIENINGELGLTGRINREHRLDSFELQMLVLL